MKPVPTVPNSAGENRNNILKVVPPYFNIGRVPARPVPPPKPDELRPRNNPQRPERPPPRPPINREEENLRRLRERPAPQRPAPQRPAPQRSASQRPATQRVVGTPLILGPDQQRPAPQRVVGTPLILGTIPKKAVNKKQDGTPLILGTIPKVSERVPATPIIRNDLILQPIASLTRNPPPLPPKPTKRVPPPLPPKPINREEENLRRLRERPIPPPPRPPVKQLPPRPPRDLTLNVIRPINLNVVREEERLPREPRTRMIDIPIINRINNKLIFDGVEAVTMEEARDVVETLNEYRRNVELNGNTLWIIVSTDMINGRHRIRRTTQYMVDDAILGLLFNHLLLLSSFFLSLLFSSL
jgi:hypothetical protein